MQGHSRDKCFCLVGYPSWHRLFGEPKPKPRSSPSVAHVTVTPIESPDTTLAINRDSAASASHGLSETQLQHLVTLLQSSMKSGTNTHSESLWPSANTVHFAGTVTNPSCTSESLWIIDSGATDHITAHLGILVNPVPCNAFLQLPNGHTINVTHVGDVCLTPTLILHRVLCVPTFAHNLLSIPKLLLDTNSNAFFTASTCSIQDPVSKKELEIGKIEDGLFIFTASPESSFTSVSSFCNQLSSISADLWHARLGHVPSSVLQQLSMKCTVDFHDCDTCHFAKQAKLPFDNSDSCSTVLFELIHADV